MTFCWLFYKKQELSFAFASSEDHGDGGVKDGGLEVDAETAWLRGDLRFQRRHVEEQRAIRGRDGGMQCFVVLRENELPWGGLFDVSKTDESSSKCLR